MQRQELFFVNPIIHRNVENAWSIIGLRKESIHWLNWVYVTLGKNIPSLGFSSPIFKMRELDGRAAKIPSIAHYQPLFHLLFFLPLPFAWSLLSLILLFKMRAKQPTPRSRKKTGNDQSWSLLHTSHYSEYLTGSLHLVPISPTDECRY